jgi:hypothetical protein
VRPSNEKVNAPSSFLIVARLPARTRVSPSRYQTFTIISPPAVVLGAVGNTLYLWGHYAKNRPG